MKFITAALLFLLTIPGLAGAQARISKDSYWTGNLEMCEDGLGGRPFPEPLALIGIERFLFKISENGNQKTIEIQRGEISGKAIGRITGIEYPFHIQSKIRSTFSWDSEMEVKFIEHYSFTIPVLGYKVRVSAHIDYGKDLEVRTEVENVRTECP